MARSIYVVQAGADVALVAATPKSVLGCRGGAAFALELLQLSVAFDQSGASAPTNEPILVELCYATFATNAPGTNSTSETPLQWSGRVTTHGTTNASNWTTEPTVLTVLDEFLVHPQAGFKEYLPLGDMPDTALNEGFAMRITAPNAVNCRPGFRFARN
jgi:hypothetical protein